MGIKDRVPPRWADKFLAWYCHPDLLEEIQGDVHELFLRKVSDNPMVARLQFIWNVIRFFRPRNIRRASRRSNSTLLSSDMIKSYITSALRSIRRNSLPSSINIIGLSIALGCGVTIFLLIDSYYNRDTFHKQRDRLFLLMNEMRSGDTVEKWARSPYLLGPALKEAHSGVEAVVRIQTGSLDVRHGDAVFSEPVWFADEDFFKAFSYPILYGKGEALNGKSNIVITEDIAVKYFGRKDVLNQEITVKFPDEHIMTFKVGAVLAHVPDNSSMFLNVIIPMIHWVDHVDAAHNIQWRTWAASTFILMKEGHRPDALQGLVKKFTKVQNEANDKFQIQSVEWVPITEVAALSYDIKYALSWSNIPAAMIALGLIAGFLVALACFNYMNVAVAAVSSRIREIGIRKVIGGGKSQIIQQFLIENIVLCSLAMAVGVCLAYFIFLPGFNTLYPIHIPFEFSSTGMMFLFFGCTLLTVTLVSGGYPAFYVSSFNPVAILRGKEKFGDKSLFGKVLLSVQFILSFTTIAACLIFVSSSEYFEKKDWGYNHAQQLFTAVEDITQFRALKNKILQHKNIISVAGSESHIGYAEHTTTVSVGNEEMNVVRLEVGFNYLETMDVRLDQGRSFDENIASDRKESVIINNAFARKMGWKDPLDEFFEFDGHKWFVVGVVKDFHYQEFYYNIEPVMIHIGPDEKFRYLVAKVQPGTLDSVSAYLRQSWSGIAPDDPYEGLMQDQVFEQFFNSNRSNNKIMYFLSSIALVLACMGLYGLISYNLTRRLKEFSIRKIFGANLFHILRLMNRDFAWIILISFGIGVPLGFYMMGLMIRAAYPEEIPIALWPFVSTAALMILTVLLTILTQLRRVSTVSPTALLRND